LGNSLDSAMALISLTLEENTFVSAAFSLIKEDSSFFSLFLSILDENFLVAINFLFFLIVESSFLTASFAATLSDLICLTF